jgi:glyceraldehyde 3-phosphate dehydrogenase
MPKTPIRFAINGLGRIGRALVRVAEDRPDLELVAVNDLVPSRVSAHLLERDSLHGRGPEARIQGERILIGERSVASFQESDPAAIDWQASGAEVVVECTGHFLDRASLDAHFRPGIRHILVSANAEGVDATLCLGVNDDELDARHHRVISNASCSTNCAATMAVVLDRKFGLRHGLLTTVHSFTGDQRLLDGGHLDLRRSRAATLNMIPTATGAAEAVGLVLPHLADRLQGQAIRVPIADVSLMDLVVELEVATDLAAIREAYLEASSGQLAGILAVTEEELVSTDFLGDPHSAVVDLPLLQHAGDRLFRVVAWYDNEWGYAHRLADLLERLEVME